jgi:hypothetical protein
MKFRNLKKWVIDEKTEGLAFFAQLLEELLFDYSHDTYKPSAMNSSTLCLEAKDLIRDIENEIIDRANLSHVLQELMLNLRKDEVAKSLLDIELETIEPKFNNKDLPLRELAVIIDIIYSQLSILAYKEKTELFLLDALKNEREKDRIRALTRSYVTTLITIGYSTKYLYTTAGIYFHSQATISESEDVKGFFELVSGKKQKYIAVFRASLLFEEIKNSCKNFKIEIAHSLKADLSGHVNSKNFSLKSEQIYLVVKEFDAMDVYSARDIAERRIEQLSALTSLFHHKEITTWDKIALLINLNKKSARIVTSSKNPMLMCADLTKKNAAYKLDSFIHNFSVKEEDSFQRFKRATELHALALRSDSPENQLLNLWVALETITPSKLARNKAKVNNIIDSIQPFLSINYLPTLTAKLAHDLFIWNKSAFFRAIKGINGECERDKLIKLLVLEQHQEARTRLYQDIGHFYLLRNRVHYFSEILSSTRKMAKILEAHQLRVDWQIRRIYRTRNLIVHAGHTPSYIKILIKNTHNYLDVVTDTIGQLASDGDRINTIDEAFKYIEIKYEEYYRLLKNNNGSVAIDVDNIDKYLLGDKL